MRVSGLTVIDSYSITTYPGRIIRPTDLMTYCCWQIDWRWRHGKAVSVFSGSPRCRPLKGRADLSAFPWRHRQSICHDDATWIGRDTVAINHRSRRLVSFLVLVISDSYDSSYSHSVDHKIFCWILGSWIQLSILVIPWLYFGTFFFNVLQDWHKIFLVSGGRVAFS